MLNKLLEQNPYSRPGIFFKERPTCLVIHWIGPYPMQTWEDVWSWWSKAPSHKRYGSLGIEMTVEGSDGAISDATWDTTVNWLREQCVRLELEPFRDIITHQMVTGKRCPLWMADHPGELERMRQDVEY